jgi:ParB/RepB/Spo0J family partition protein
VTTTSNRTLVLAVLTHLGNGRTVAWTGNACNLMPRQVVDIAADHGALRSGGVIDSVAAAMAAGKLRSAPGALPPATESVAPRQNPPPTPGPPQMPAAGLYVQIDVRLIDVDGRNVRTDLGDLTELAASIKAVGILQPLTVDAEGARYRLRYGHRRLAAAKLAGHGEVPCIVRSPLADPAVRVERLIENLHRKNLEPLEEAKAYQQLIAAGMTQADVARRVAVSQATVSARLSLLVLPPAAQAMVRDKRLPLVEATKLASQVRANGSGAVVHKEVGRAGDLLSPNHPLAASARKACTHIARRLYAGACTPCWETAVRTDERARVAEEEAR